MSQKYCSFQLVIYEDGERHVLLEEIFESLKLRRTHSSDVITVYWTVPGQSEQTFQYELSNHEHLVIRGL